MALKGELFGSMPGFTLNGKVVPIAAKLFWVSSGGWLAFVWGWADAAAGVAF